MTDLTIGTGAIGAGTSRSGARRTAARDRVAAATARWMRALGLAVVLTLSAISGVAAQATQRPANTPPDFQIQPDPGTEKELRRQGDATRGATPGAPAPKSGEIDGFVVGHTALLPSSALYVMVEAGLSDDLGWKVVPRRFTRDEEIAAALAIGEIDLGYVDAGAVLVAREAREGRPGAPLMIVAGAAMDSYILIAQGSVAKFVMFGEPGPGLNRAMAAAGRRLTLATLPVGTSYHAVLNGWLTRRTALGPEDMLLLGSRADRVWAGLLQGVVELALVPEPIATDLLSKSPTAVIAADPAELGSGVPTTVVAVAPHVAAAKRARLIAFVARHGVATRRLQDEPGRWATMVQRHVGYGKLKPELLAQALDSPGVRFVADPSQIESGVAELARRLLAVGALVKPQETRGLVDLRIWAEAGQI